MPTRACRSRVRSRPPVVVGGRLQPGQYGDAVRRLRDGRVVRPQMLGELRPDEPLRTVVEPVHGPTVPARVRFLSDGAAQEAPEAASTQPPQHRLPFVEEGEVVDFVAAFAQPADGRGEAAGVRDRHGRDHDAVVPGRREVEDLDDTLPPGGRFPEVPPQFWRQHAAQPESGVLRIADDTARETTPHLVHGLRPAAPEGAVDPQQHAQPLPTRGLPVGPVRRVSPARRPGPVPSRRRGPPPAPGPAVPAWSGCGPRGSSRSPPTAPGGPRSHRWTGPARPAP